MPRARPCWRPVRRPEKAIPGTLARHAIPIGERLVASTRRSDADDNSASTAAAQSAICSRLSRTNSSSRSRIQSASTVPTGRPASSGTASVEATAEATSPPSLIVASGTKKAPSRKPSARRDAARSARRVLPAPPGPVRVISLRSARSSARPSSSTSRPTKVVASGGRCARRTSSARSGGNAAGSPRISSCQSASGSGRSFSRYDPSGRRRTPSGRVPTTRLRVESEMSTCPPCPAAAMRAARLTSRPTYSSAPGTPMPVWSPIRTRIVASFGQAAVASAISACTAASTADRASGNTTKNESPSVPSSMPPFAAIAPRSSRWCCSKASVNAADPSSRRSCVERSISEKRNVTVPVGSPRFVIGNSA